MRAKCLIAATLGLVFALSGCSSKKYFNPENVQKFPAKTQKAAKVDPFAPAPNSGYEYKTSADGKLQITSLASGQTHTVQLDSQVASIGVLGNLAVIVDAQNHLRMFDLLTESTVFSHDFGPSFGVIAPLAPPVFSKELALVPTLDGRLAVLNIAQKTLTRVINVGINDSFNNIIHLRAYDDKMLAASASKAISIFANRTHQLAKSIKTIANNEEFIYIFTSSGELIKTDFTFRELASKRFEFAAFSAASLRDDGYLYALENTGKLLKIDPQTLEPAAIYSIGGKLKAPAAFAPEGLIYNHKLFTLQ